MPGRSSLFATALLLLSCTPPDDDESMPDKPSVAMPVHKDHIKPSNQKYTSLEDPSTKPALPETACEGTFSGAANGTIGCTGVSAFQKIGGGTSSIVLNTKYHGEG